ncbi:MAG TPA: hypothetical protein VGK19_05780 [Capsulimonadaceae bacterium]|jgi:predicted PurR-regulated permease PerM
MTLDTAATVSLYIVLVFVVIFALLTVGLLAVIAFGLRSLEAKVDSALEQVKPVLSKTTETLDVVQRVTSNIGDRADAILERGETTTESVARKVEATASVVQKAVSTPLINISSLIAGLTEGLSSLGRHFGKSQGKDPQ